MTSPNPDTIFARAIEAALLDTLSAIHRYGPLSPLSPQSDAWGEIALKLAAVRGDVRRLMAVEDRVAG